MRPGLSPPAHRSRAHRSGAESGSGGGAGDPGGGVGAVAGPSRPRPAGTGRSAAAGADLDRGRAGRGAPPPAGPPRAGVGPRRRGRGAAGGGERDLGAGPAAGAAGAARGGGHPHRRRGPPAAAPGRWHRPHRRRAGRGLRRRPDRPAAAHRRASRVRGAGVLPGAAVSEHAAARRFPAGRDARHRAAPDGDDPPPPAGRCPAGRPAGAGLAVPGDGAVPDLAGPRQAQHPGHRDAGVRQDDPVARPGPGDPRRRAGRHPGNRVRAQPAPAPGPGPAAGGHGVPTRVDRGRPGHRAARRRGDAVRPAAPDPADVGDPGDRRGGPRRRSAADARGHERRHARLDVHPARRLRDRRLRTPGHRRHAGRRQRLVRRLRHPPGRPRHRLRRAPAPPPPPPHPSPHRRQHRRRAARPRRNCRPGGPRLRPGRVGSSPRSPR